VNAQAHPGAPVTGPANGSANDRGSIFEERFSSPPHAGRSPKLGPRTPSAKAAGGGALAQKKKQFGKRGWVDENLFAGPTFRGDSAARMDQLRHSVQRSRPGSTMSGRGAGAQPTFSYSDGGAERFVHRQAGCIIIGRAARGGVYSEAAQATRLSRSRFSRRSCGSGFSRPGPDVEVLGLMRTAYGPEAAEGKSVV